MDTTGRTRHPVTMVVIALLMAAIGPVVALGHRAEGVPAQATSATDGARTLTLSQAAELAPGGQTITVTGSGYDVDKGIYVALCVIPPAGTVPSPCGGGEDRLGQTGASGWISSNPPSYAEGLPVPYGPGGTFRIDIGVSAQVAPGVDCRVVGCAVVSRSDHTRTLDRSQDVFVPVTFAADPVDPGQPTPVDTLPTTVPTVVTTTTTSTTLPEVPSTTTTLAPGGLQVSDGTRTLALDRATGLAPEGDEVKVSLSGFDTSKGVYVALCAPLPAPGASYGPCATGESRSIWVSSAPPEWGTDLAEPFGEGGTFEGTLELDPDIDGTVDCTTLDCAVVVRGDDQSNGDRSQELALPVTFDGPPRPDDAESTTTSALEATSDGEVAVDDEPEQGGAPVGLLVGIVVVLLVAAGLAFAKLRGGQANAGDAGAPDAGTGPAGTGDSGAGPAGDRP